MLLLHRVVNLRRSSRSATSLVERSLELQKPHRRNRKQVWECNWSYQIALATQCCSTRSEHTTAQHISKLFPSIVSPTVTMWADFRNPPTIFNIPAAYTCCTHSTAHTFAPVVQAALQLAMVDTCTAGNYWKLTVRKQQQSLWHFGVVWTAGT